jgi:SET domain-containing protein
MFLIPTFLAPSTIHGMGVFTAVDVPAGTNIWFFDDGVDWRIRPEELLAFPEPFRTRVRDYSYVDGEGFHVFCGDNARYMNHSEDPNCDDSGDVYTVARRDLTAGEELTCDYRSFDAESVDRGQPYIISGA